MKLSPEVAARAQDPSEQLVLAKANSRSTVYRANYLDYVSVKKRDQDGTVTGEFRFLGLYTHSAHTEPIASIPVLRRKLAQVLARPGCPRTAMTARTWPRSSRTIRGRSSSRSRPKSSPRSRWACCG